MWFSKTDSTPPKSYHGHVDYPSGTCVVNENGAYLVKGSKLYRFGSPRAQESWGLFVVPCLPVNIEHMEVAGVLGFREGTLLSKFSDGSLHVVAQNKTRHVVDPDALEHFGLLGKRIYDVSDREFQLHDTGKVLQVNG